MTVPTIESHSVAVRRWGGVLAVLGFGVMSTPALVIDDAVVVVRRVPSVDQLRTLLESKRA